MRKDTKTFISILSAKYPDIPINNIKDFAEYCADANDVDMNDDDEYVGTFDKQSWQWVNLATRYDIYSYLYLDINTRPPCDEESGWTDEANDKIYGGK